MLHYTEIKKIEAILISVDFEKAFDRVDYSAMFAILDYFGFGHCYINLIKILFEQFYLATTNVGHVSEFFTPSWGLFQGNPIASFLFTTIMETLAINLRANPNIDPIVIKQTKYLISQFADDLDLFMKYNAASFQVAIDELLHFEHISRMKVNLDKTMVYRIGSLRYSQAKLYSRFKIHWSDKPINILGVHISHELQQIADLNYSELLDKAHRILVAWKGRGLTLLHKIQIVNSLVASIFVYRMTLMPRIDLQVKQKFNSLVNKFIWQGKRAKIPSNILNGNKADGGQNLVNIDLRDKATKIAWVFKLLKFPKLQDLVYEIMQNPIGNLIWQCNLNTKDIQQIFQKGFWMDVLACWVEFRRLWSQNMNTEQDNSILWYNSKIRIGGKPCFWKHWFQKGIVKIEHLIDDTGYMAFDNFKENYPGLPFTEYFGMLNALKALKPVNIGKSCLQSYLLIDKLMGSIYKILAHEDNLLEFHFLKFK